MSKHTPTTSQQYYTEVVFSEDVQEHVIDHSQFRIVVNLKGEEVQEAIHQAFESFYRAKAIRTLSKSKEALTAAKTALYWS